MHPSIIDQSSTRYRQKIAERPGIPQQRLAHEDLARLLNRTLRTRNYSQTAGQERIMSKEFRLSRIRRPRATPASIALIVTTYLLFGAILFGALTTLAEPERGDLQPRLGNDPGFVIRNWTPGP